MSNVMGLASDCIRGVLVAARGRKLCISDLANIEGRKAAWLCGEEWKLEAFRAFDAKRGPDLYKVAYGRSFDVPPETVGDDSDERQIGKVMELALQYQGRVGAFVTMAATYGVDLDKLALFGARTIPKETLRESEEFYDWCVKKNQTLGLARNVFVVCNALTMLWRAAHPAISSSWKELEGAAALAIQNPGCTFEAAMCTFDRIGNYMRVKLPSGRYLCYAHPKVEQKISYMGVNLGRWWRIDTYGGKLLENIVQASSRDIMAAAMTAIEAAGYPIVLTVHDEIITETLDREEFNDKHLSKLLAANPPWALDLPLAAKGFTTRRYRKG